MSENHSEDCSPAKEESRLGRILFGFPERGRPRAVGHAPAPDPIEEPCCGSGCWNCPIAGPGTELYAQNHPTTVKNFTPPPKDS